MPHARKDTNSAAPPVFSPLRGELRPNGGKIGAGANARHDQSHIRIIRSAAAFRRNPRDVLVRVFDIAGFAMDAVLPIDHEPGLTSLFHPFVHRSRTVARRWSGIDVVLG